MEGSRITEKTRKTDGIRPAGKPKDGRIFTVTYTRGYRKIAANHRMKI
jgi:hypothetical protein